jgi:hypothetical protein
MTPTEARCQELEQALFYCRTGFQAVLDTRFLKTIDGVARATITLIDEVLEVPNGSTDGK